MHVNAVRRYMSICTFWKQSVITFNMHITKKQDNIVVSITQRECTCVYDWKMHLYVKI